MQLRNKSHRIAYLAVLVAIGSAVWALEELIPRPLPWVKPGLANVATLIAIYILSPWDGLTVALFRVLIGALLLGRIGTAGFIISISAAIVSALVMATVKTTRLPFSIYGISLFGALFHSITQLAVAGYLVYNFRAVVYFLPCVLLPSLLTGILVGYLASLVISKLPVKLDRV